MDDMEREPSVLSASEQLLRMDLTADVGIQFIMYFKLTSRKHIIRSEKHLARIEQNKVTHRLLRRTLDKAGLTVIDVWRSEDGMKYHWGITASESRLRAHADRIHYELKLSPEFGGGTAPYYANQTQLFERPDGSIFSDLDRQRLVLSIIQSKQKIGGAEINIQSLFRDKLLYRFFPLHEQVKQEWLLKQWVLKPWKRQQVNLVRDYFGEKLAFYFGFMGYCIKWLMPAAIIGIIIFILQNIKSLQSYTYIGSAIFSIFMQLWSILFIDFWKRKSIARSVKWGTDKLEIREESRPVYTGFARVGVWWGSEWIDLKDVSKKDKNFRRLNIFESHGARIRRAVLFSWPLLVLMILVSMGIAFGFIVLSAKVYESTGPKVGVSVLNGIFIVVLSVIYRKIAYMLTERENHRTESDAEDSLIIKVFVFDFINAFGTLFWQGFVKYNVRWDLPKWMPNLGKGLCSAVPKEYKFPCVLQDLSVLLISIFVVRILVFQMLDFLIPFFYTRIRLCFTKTRVKRAGKGNLPTNSQLESKMASFGGTMDEYSGMVMQFGYVTMFAAAMPLGPAIAWISFMIEVRTDAYKVLKLCQRTQAKPARDIGIYQAIIEFMGYAAIVTNCALIGFADNPGAEELAFRLSLVILCENLILAIKFIMTKLLPKVPESVRQELARREFIKEELFGQDLADKLPRLDSSGNVEGQPESSGAEAFSFLAHQSVASASLNPSIQNFHHRTRSMPTLEGEFIDFVPEPLESSSSDEDYGSNSDEGSDSPLLSKSAV